ncbi:Spy/CpxP family protein refolding chaperone [Enterobacter mori]|uniref:Spy/CpxP family protein refolding chaperone n=1 Tax=Enterobacter mori TaxID=539813 RepID=UPI003B83A9FE
MLKKSRIALVAAALVACSFSAQAENVQTAPVPAQDPLVQRLKLSDEQVTKIQGLHKKLQEDVSRIPMIGVKDGALISVIQSGKWDDSAVKSQLAAFSKIQEQARYYRVQYYFNVSQVLTPEQRTQVRSEMAAALSK